MSIAPTTTHVGRRLVAGFLKSPGQILPQGGGSKRPPGQGREHSQRIEPTAFNGRVIPEFGFRKVLNRGPSQPLPRMPWEYSDEYYTEYTRTTWNESATAYVDWMRNLEPFRSEALVQLKPRPGERILDLGTGPGEPALTIAREVGSDGRVFGVDLSEKMIQIADQVRSGRKIHNAEFQVMDCSKLTFPDASFDAAISCFGFQIFTNPETAASEAYRVLRPEGRILATVWSTGNKVPFLDVIIAPMLEHAEPDATGYLPTPYETGGPGEMVAFLEAAGFRRAEERRVTHVMRYESEQAYLESILTATPIGHSLSEESKEVQEEVLTKTRANLQKWAAPEGILLPAECVIAEAHKP